MNFLRQKDLALPILGKLLGSVDLYVALHYGFCLDADSLSRLHRFHLLFILASTKVKWRWASLYQFVSYLSGTKP